MMNKTNIMDKQIVYNSVTCLECNETIVSYHRHDYKTCECPNGAMVDGGTAYQRYGAMDMSKIKLFAVYADDDYEIVRRYATRGSRGVDGKQPLKWIPLCDMEDDHLEAVLDYGGADWHLELIRKEIEYRKTQQNIPENGTNCEDELNKFINRLKKIGIQLELEYIRKNKRLRKEKAKHAMAWFALNYGLKFSDL